MSKGGGTTFVKGYRYFLSMLMGMCRGPIDGIIAIKIGEQMAWTGVVTTNSSIDLDADTLFGGDDKEGGVKGELVVMFGDPTQDIHATTPVPSIMAANGVPLMSDLRGVTTLFFRHGHITSNNPYLKPWKFLGTRTVSGWDGGTPWYAAEAGIPIFDDAGNTIMNMNPAHIIYECLTNKAWGRGLDPAALDEDSFASAANTLCREGFGLCLKWSRESELQVFIQTVINHIGAALYVDRATGLFNLKLLRQDYDPSLLPTFDFNSGLMKVNENTQTMPDNSHSEIIVGYTDILADKPRQIRIQNTAGTVANQSIASTTANYPGVCNGNLAGRLGQRDMSMQAPGIRRLELVFDRRGRKIAPGGVFKVSVPTHDIASIVLRAVKVVEGMADQPTITVSAVEDVFAMEQTSYIAVGPGTWQPPDRTPQQASIRRVNEINYRDLFRIESTAQLLTVVDTDTGITTAAVQPSAASIDYVLTTHGFGQPPADRGRFAFTPSGVLSDAINYYDTDITLDLGAVMLDRVHLAGIAWLDDECVRVDAIDPVTRTATIARGCVDTIPAPHSAGARIWFGELTWGGDGITYAIGENVSVEIRPRTSTSTLTGGPVDTVPMFGRQGRPYPPGNLTVDGSGFGNLLDTITADTVFEWADRDRVMQADHILIHSDGSTGPEPGTTYTVRIYDSFAVLVRTDAAATSPWTYTAAMKTADGVTDYTFQLKSVRDTLDSFQEYVVPIHAATPGAFGFDYDFDHEFG